MIREIQILIDDYYAWLKDKTDLHQIDQWVEITTPYLDRHNDYLQIYAKDSNGGFVLTDDGYTIEDLSQSGCNLESPKRQDLLQMTLNGFGVQKDGRALQVLCISRQLCGAQTQSLAGDARRQRYVLHGGTHGGEHLL